MAPQHTSIKHFAALASKVPVTDGKAETATATEWHRTTVPAKRIFVQVERDGEEDEFGFISKKRLPKQQYDLNSPTSSIKGVPVQAMYPAPMPDCIQNPAQAKDLRFCFGRFATNSISDRPIGAQKVSGRSSRGIAPKLSTKAGTNTSDSFEEKETPRKLNS
ncbi:hypothetical protein BJ742DRAFT_164239 [Cladochytrium replicatum]|nr:hypothetical protein BJ742DRAFT_164239 [Cladochytrium replicatum]